MAQEGSLNGAQSPLPSVSVVICTLNEEGSIPITLARIPQFVTEVVLVDGRSIDRTIEVARQAYPGVKVHVQPGRGKGDALRHGLSLATGEIVVTLDADGATDPAEMWRFIEPLLNGWDFTKGSRFKNGPPLGMKLHRIIGNWGLAMTGNVLFGVWWTDVCSGYNALWRRSLNQLDWQGMSNHDYEIVLYWRALRRGLKVKEVGHRDGGRIAGESKMPSIHTALNNFKIIVRERFRRLPESSPVHH